jgi:hypothetical protein
VIESTTSSKDKGASFYGCIGLEGFSSGLIEVVIQADDAHHPVPGVENRCHRYVTRVVA